MTEKKKGKIRSAVGNTVGRKKHPKRFWPLLIVGVILGVLLFWWVLQGFAARPTEGYMTVTVVDMGDDYKDVSDEAKVAIYESDDVSEMNVDDINKLDYNDYDKVVEDTPADEVNFYLESNHLYYMRIKYGSTVIWRVPDVGENVIVTIDKTESITLKVYDEDGDQLVDGTYNGSADREYELKVKCESDEGLISSYLFDEDDYNLLWFNITFDVAAQDDYVDITNYYNKKHVSVNSTFLGINCMIDEDAEYTLEFDSAKGTTFDVIDIEVNFGTYGSFHF